MKIVERRLVVSSRVARELHVSPVTGGSRPEVTLNVSELERCFRFAKLDYVPNDAIAALDDLTTEYVIGRQQDSLSATPGEAHKLAEDMEQAVKVLRRAVSNRLLSPFISADLDESLDLFDKAANGLRATAGPIQKGGAKEIKARRRRQFADGLVALFRVQGWPDQTSRRSLMTDVFVICLEEAAKSLLALGVIEDFKDEEIKKPEDILKAAAKRAAS